MKESDLSLLVEISHLILIVVYSSYSAYSAYSSYSHYTERNSGGYCGGVPPLPIPNREVKPACADGTAMQCGRVGGRHFSREALSTEMLLGAFSCFVVLYIEAFGYIFCS